MNILARLYRFFKPRRQMTFYQMMDRNLAAGRLVYPDWSMYNG